MLLSAAFSMAVTLTPVLLGRQCHHGADDCVCDDFKVNMALVQG